MAPRGEKAEEAQTERPSISIQCVYETSFLKLLDVQPASHLGVAL